MEDRISWFIFQLIYTKIQAYKFLYIFQPPSKMFTSRDIDFGMAFPIDSIGKDILSHPGKCPFHDKTVFVRGHYMFAKRF